jgi:hypothetical protein
MYILCSFANLGIANLGVANLGELGIGVVMSLVLTLHAHFLNLVLTTYFGELALA